VLRVMGGGGEGLGFEDRAQSNHDVTYRGLSARAVQRRLGSLRQAHGHPYQWTAESYVLLRAGLTS
jgi:hypothetical protein